MQARIDQLEIERDEARKEQEFYEIEYRAALQELDDAQADAKALRVEIAQLETAYDRACGYCTCGSLDAAEAERDALREAGQYALDAISSPDTEFAPGKDIYEQRMMLGAARRLRAALSLRATL
jgi:alkylhydroperoxidase family enzyme